MIDKGWLSDDFQVIELYKIELRVMHDSNIFYIK